MSFEQTFMSFLLIKTAETFGNKNDKSPFRFSGNMVS